MFKHWKGETAQSTDAPKTFCNSGETGRLCGSSTCFSCNSIREMQAQKVRGTLLASFLESYFLGVGYYYIDKTKSVHSLIKFKQIPCRTAMRGSFPLNGTYFQVNEVNISFHIFFAVEELTLGPSDLSVYERHYAGICWSLLKSKSNWCSTKLDMGPPKTNCLLWNLSSYNI